MENILDKPAASPSTSVPILYIHPELNVVFAKKPKKTQNKPYKGGSVCALPWILPFLAQTPTWKRLWKDSRCV